MGAEDVVVKSGYKGRSVELVYTNSFLALERNCVLEIDFPSGKVFGWNFVLRFTDQLASDGRQFGATSKVEGKTIELTFYNWLDISSVENTEPYRYTSKQMGHEFYVRVSTRAVKEYDIREIQFSIWQVSK